MAPSNSSREPQVQVADEDIEANNTMEKDCADPEAVLRHDYVGLLMLAAQNGPQLLQLIEWGETLRYYIGMIQANYPTSTVQVPRVEVDKTWNDPVSLLDYDPAGVAIRTKGNASLQSQLVEFGTQLEHYAKMNETLLSGNNTNAIAEEAQPDAALSGDTVTGSEEPLLNIKSEEEPEPAPAPVEPEPEREAEREPAPAETAVSEQEEAPEAMEDAVMEEPAEPDPITAIQEGAASGVEASGDGTVRSKRKRMTPKQKAAQLEDTSWQDGGLNLLLNVLKEEGKIEQDRKQNLGYPRGDLQKTTRTTLRSIYCILKDKDGKDQEKVIGAAAPKGDNRNEAKLSGMDAEAVASFLDEVELCEGGFVAQAGRHWFAFRDNKIMDGGDVYKWISKDEDPKTVIRQILKTKGLMCHVLPREGNNGN